MIKFMIKFIKSKIGILVLFSLISLFSTVMSIVIPYYNGAFIDLVTTTLDKNIVIYFAIFLGLISTTSIFVNYIYGVMEGKAKLELSYSLYTYIVKHYQKISLIEQKKYNSVYLNQRINTDVNILGNFFLRYYINIFIQFISLIILLYSVFSLNIYIGLATVILIPIYICVYLRFKTPLYREGIASKEIGAEYFKIGNEQINLITEIKANSLYESSDRWILREYKKYFNAVMKYTKVSYIFKLSNNIITILLKILILVVGGFEIIDNNLTLGEFVIINSYYEMIFSTINGFLNVTNEYQNAKNSYDRIKDILSIPIESNGRCSISKVDNIYIDNVSYGYENSDIKEFMTLNFKKGKPYVIIGENGKGKSTLLLILTGLLKRNSGNIYYNDINIDDINMIDLRKNNLSMYVQNSKSLDTTVIENIKYYLNIVKEDILYKIKENNLEKIFLNNKFNIRNYFDRDILKLSGGEIQKINLLCTLLDKKDVLILDEPTSNIDEYTAILLSEFIEKISQETIVLIVTHDKKFLNSFKETIEIVL